MISFDAASDIINSTNIHLKPETISVLNALNRVSYNDVISKVDYPAENNSAMDGYALSSHAAAKINANGLKLEIDKNVIYAGDGLKTPAKQDSAIRIMTGGYLPEKFDAVIPIEDAVTSGSRLILKSPVKPGKNVRKKGEDIKRGDIILHKNTRLTPETISLLASCNIKKIRVYEKIPVSIISTGNEILNFKQKPRYGKIYNSNGILAENFLFQNGCIAVNNAICKDNLNDIENALSSAIKTSKIIITSAGASFGDKDFTEKALESIGFKIKFRQVAIKPAKPFSFGLINKKIPVFILPGNPIAFYTCLSVFVKPFINRHIKINSRLNLIKSRSSFEYIKTNNRREFIPAYTFNKNGVVYSEIYKKSGPAMISSLGYMNSIVSFPENSSLIIADELLDTYLI
ncbi:MAG: molybdopterin molybdotransferase MoeA [bacterium]